MKKRNLALMFVCSACLFTASFCKKSVSDIECSTGGTGIGGFIPTYKVWTKIAMYNTSVEIRDNRGNIVETKIMKGYYLIPANSSTEPDACKQEEGPAIFSLSKGTHYLYTAINGSKQWSGTIDVPCSPDQCYNVEIK